MPRIVTLVAGPPCAGKSTYVAQHAKPGDLILDQDAIGATVMRRQLTHVAAMTTGTAWVIRCSPGPQQRDALARHIHATHVVLLRPTDTELLARAAHRPNPRRHIQAVRDWIQRETLDQPPRQRATGATRKPRAQLTTTQRGYDWEHRRARAAALKAMQPDTPCPFCQQPMVRGMALDYDHYPPLALGGGGIRRLTHASCNRRAGQALGQARRRARKQQPRPTHRAINSQRW